MSVINPIAQYLSNYEVMAMLRSSPQEVRACKSLATLSYETLKYLDKTPAIKQDEQVVQQFLERMKTFPKPLTKVEKLQILNLRPSNFAEIQVIIESLEDRLTETDLQELLSLIEEIIPPIEEEEPAEQS